MLMTMLETNFTDSGRVDGSEQERAPCATAFAFRTLETFAAEWHAKGEEAAGATRWEAALPCFSRAIAALLNDPATQKDNSRLLAAYLGRLRCNKQIREHGAVVHDCDIIVRIARHATQPERIAAIRERALAYEALERPHKALEDWRLLRTVCTAPDEFHLKTEARLASFIASERALQKSEAADREWMQGQMMWRVAIKEVPAAVVLGQWAELRVQLMNEHGLFTPSALEDQPVPLRITALLFDANTVFSENDCPYDLELDEKSTILGANGKAVVKFRLLAPALSPSSTSGLPPSTSSPCVTLRIEGLDQGGLMAVLSSAIKVVPTWQDQPFESMDSAIASETYRTFLFRGRLVRVKEDYPQGSLGGRVWDAAYGLARYLEGPAGDALHGKRVIELGAGTGFLACCLALLGAQVYVTDLPDMLDGIRTNLSFNGILAPPSTPPASGMAAVESLQWGDDTSSFGPPFDFVIGSDLVYEPKWFEPLAHSMAALSSPATQLLLAYRHRHDEQHCQMYFFEEHFVVKRRTFAEVDLLTPMPCKDVLLLNFTLKVKQPKVEEIP